MTYNNNISIYTDIESGYTLYSYYILPVSLLLNIYHIILYHLFIDYMMVLV